MISDGRKPQAQEATFGWSFPSARDEVKHIVLSDHGLEVNQMVIMS